MRDPPSAILPKSSDFGVPYQRYFAVFVKLCRTNAKVVKICCSELKPCFCCGHQLVLTCYERRRCWFLRQPENFLLHKHDYRPTNIALPLSAETEATRSRFWWEKLPLRRDGPNRTAFNLHGPKSQSVLVVVRGETSQSLDERPWIRVVFVCWSASLGSWTDLLQSENAPDAPNSNYARISGCSSKFGVPHLVVWEHTANVNTTLHGKFASELLCSCFELLHTWWKQLAQRLPQFWSVELTGKQKSILVLCTEPCGEPTKILLLWKEQKKLRAWSFVRDLRHIN